MFSSALYSEHTTIRRHRLESHEPDQQHRPTNHSEGTARSASGRHAIGGAPRFIHSRTHRSILAIILAVGDAVAIGIVVGPAATAYAWVSLVGVVWALLVAVKCSVAIGINVGRAATT